MPGPESTASQAPITGPDAICKGLDLPFTRNPHLQLPHADFGTAFFKFQKSGHRRPSTAAQRLTHALTFPCGRPRFIADSGHLECPCTDRINKTITETYATQGNGQCASEVNTAASCFKASAFLGFEPANVQNATVTSATLPKGCFLEASNGTVTLTFNDVDKARSSVDCGPKAGAPIRLTGRASQYVTMSVDIDASAPAAKQVTITLEGPAAVWYGVGLGAQVMKDAPNAIIVSGNGTVFEQKLADQSRGTQLAFSLAVVSNTVVGTCTRSLTCSHSHTRSLAHWLTRSPTHPPTRSPAHPPTDDRWVSVRVRVRVRVRASGWVRARRRCV